MRHLKKHSIFLIGTATSLEEAALLETHGIDAIVAQGYEAGGHRGSFFICFHCLTTNRHHDISFSVCATYFGTYHRRWWNYAWQRHP